MKKTALATLFIILISLSCIFYSCNSDQSIFNDEKEAETNAQTPDYEKMIRDLEDQIIEIKQSQYISEAERNQEIVRLETLIDELKNSATDTETSTETSPPTESDDESEEAEPAPPSSAFLYIVENDQAIITGYEGQETVIAIPKVIDGYKVVAIGDDAFDEKSIQRVIVPEGVIKIGWFAFSECKNLCSVTLPKSITQIGYSAFPADVVKFSLICPADSFAVNYAKSYGLSYTVI